MNPCTVVITRGKNKGKLCGHVNARCKHVSKLLTCDECGMTFDRSTSYRRHISTHQKTKDKILINIKRKEEEEEEAVPSWSPAVRSQEDIYRKLEHLEKINNSLREEVVELKNKPVTMTHNYITIMGDSNYYHELIHKLGRDNAIKFLTQSCVNGQLLSVFQKLYLDGRQPDDYPVACKDERYFRYLDDDQCLMDDHDGSEIGNVMSRKITDAIIRATNDAIIQDTSNDISSGTQVMDNLHSVQSALCIDTEAMIKDLAIITNNPGHPFFRDDFDAK